MKLGIKVGPQQRSIDDLEQTKAPFAEVWFQIDIKEEYDNLFSYLTKHKIDTGLHFWGLTGNGYVPTLSYSDKKVLQESINLIKQTIDIAHQYGFSYVNIHPGFRTLVRCDYKTFIFSHTDAAVIPSEQATPVFLESIQELSSYAKAKKVLLTVETTPIRLSTESLHGTVNRLAIDNFAEYSFVPLTNDQIQFSIANDFGHTASNCISTTRKPVWDLLYQKTVDYAPKTRLLHLGYIVPPYNGTDFHDQLDNPVFETSRAVPNKQQMVELLKLFQHRDDVWALAEPNGNHVKNYFLAQKIFRDASLL